MHGNIDFSIYSEAGKEKKRNDRGTIVFEAILGVQLLVVVLFSCHVGVAKLWRDKIEELQKTRIPYDGERKWESTVRH